jgi:hypothetical protein
MIMISCYGGLWSAHTEWLRVRVSHRVPYKINATSLSVKLLVENESGSCELDLLSGGRTLPLYRVVKH